MNQTTFRRVGGFLLWLLVAYVFFWFFSLLQLVEFSPWLVILAPFGLGGASFYYYLLAPATRQTVLTSFKRYWWIWSIALLLAILTTLVPFLLKPRYQGIPWGYMVFWMFVFWMIFIITVFCFMNDDFAARVGRGIHNWAKHGGFWKIWIEDNTPANTILGIWLVLVFIAILYGPPNDFLLDTKELVSSGMEKVRKLQETNAWMTFREILDNLYGAFIGPRSSVPVAESVPQEISEPVYRKGWGWIRVVIFLFPIMFLTVIWSRRDEVADRLDSFLTFFKKERSEILTQRSGAIDKTSTTKGPIIVSVKPVSGRALFWYILTSDIIAKALIRIGSVFLDFLRRNRKK